MKPSYPKHFSIPHAIINLGNILGHSRVTNVHRQIYIGDFFACMKIFLLDFFEYLKEISIIWKLD